MMAQGAKTEIKRAKSVVLTTSDFFALGSVRSAYRINGTPTTNQTAHFLLKT
jgi:hypothetical protein